MPKERYETDGGYFVFASEEELNTWREFRETQPAYEVYLRASARLLEAENKGGLVLEATLDDFRLAKDAMYDMAKAHFEP